jgi:hypothetical protein
VGSHTFSVRARDTAGNQDPTPATRTWVVTAPPPTGGGGPVEDGALTPFSPKVAYRYVHVGARTRLTAVTVRQLPADAKLELRCAGGKRKGCTFKRKAVRHRGGDVKLARLLRKLNLKPRAAVELRIAAASGQRKIVRFMIRRGKAPKVSSRCAAPGGVPGACG